MDKILSIKKNKNTERRNQMNRLMKKGITVLSAALLTCVVLVFTSGIALATSMAYSELVMDNFQFTFTGFNHNSYVDWGPPDIVGWEKSYSKALKNTNGPNIPIPALNTTNSGYASFATIDSGDNMALAYTGMNNNAAYALAKAKGMSSEYLGQAWQSGFFTVYGGGNVQVSVDYTWTVDLQTDNLGEAAYAFAWAELALQKNWDPDNEIWHYTKRDPTFSDLQFVGNGDDLDNYTASGTLTWDFDYGCYEEGRFQVLANAYAKTTEPVPEPATMLLLGSGLLGLMGFRRKFKK